MIADIPNDAIGPDEEDQERTPQARPVPPRLAQLVAEVGGNPVRLFKVIKIEAVDNMRNIWCRHYDRCLNLAVVANWTSFGCHECRNFEGGVDRTGGKAREEPNLRTPVEPI